jgi:hypothetical protein
MIFKGEDERFCFSANIYGLSIIMGFEDGAMKVNEIIN